MGAVWVVFFSEGVETLDDLDHVQSGKPCFFDSRCQALGDDPLSGDSLVSPSEAVIGVLDALGGSV